MKKYVVCNQLVFDVIESKRTRYYVIKDKNITESILQEILYEKQLEAFASILSSICDGEIQLNWIKKEYIRDHEFVAKHNPEFLI